MEDVKGLDKILEDLIKYQNVSCTKTIGKSYSQMKKAYDLAVELDRGTSGGDILWVGGVNNSDRLRRFHIFTHLFKVDPYFVEEQVTIKLSDLTIVFPNGTKIRTVVSPIKLDINNLPENLGDLSVKGIFYEHTVMEHYIRDSYIIPMVNQLKEYNSTFDIDIDTLDSHLLQIREDYVKHNSDICHLIFPEKRILSIKV